MPGEKLLSAVCCVRGVTQCIAQDVRRLIITLPANRAGKVVAGLRLHKAGRIPCGSPPPGVAWRCDLRCRGRVAGRAAAPARRSPPGLLWGPARQRRPGIRGRNRGAGDSAGARWAAGLPARGGTEARGGWEPRSLPSPAIKPFPDVRRMYAGGSQPARCGRWPDPAARCGAAPAGRGPTGVQLRRAGFPPAVGVNVPGCAACSSPLLPPRLPIPPLKPSGIASLRMRLPK